jgi:hypothetical protein
MNLTTLCLVACIVIATHHQYYQEYLNKSIEIDLYRKFVLPPINCGPAAKKLHEIGWIEWSGHTVWKHQSNEKCMQYVSKITQSPWPNLFSSLMIAILNIMEMPLLLLSSPVFWCIVALTIPVLLFVKRYSYQDHQQSAVVAVHKIPQQNWIIHELKQIFKGSNIDEQQFIRKNE